MSLPDLSTREVWLLAGSQEMYGEKVLAEVAADARTVAAALDATAEIPVRVVLRTVATTPELIHRAMLDANEARACVGVIAWMHTFSPAKMWIAGLRELHKPLLHLHTQMHAALPWSQIDMDYMNTHQSAHGDREFAFMLTRLGVRRATVAGDWRAPAAHARIARWARAACGWAESQCLAVARFGDNMRQVAVTEGDKVEAQIRFGWAINGHGVGELADAVAAAPAAAVDALVADYEERYELAAELAVGGERRDSLIEAARIEAGLRAVLDDHGAVAFCDTFEDLHGLRQLPGIAAQRLMADGYGFGAEGDWRTSALLRTVKVMAAGLPGGSSFMEDYTYDLDRPDPQVLGAHMLEVCPSIAAARPRCEVHPLSIGGREDPVRLVFDAAPGPAVNVAMLDLGDRMRMLANVVEIVEPEQPLPRLPVARALWRPAPDFATANEAWLYAGGPHHTVLTRALDLETIEEFAQIAGVELVVIDEQTRLRELRNELRWNDAAHRLTSGC